MSFVYQSAIFGRDMVRLLIPHHAPGVRILVVRNNEIVLVRHRGGQFPWGLPGGAVNRGESLEDAAKREILEETGCRVEHIRKLHTHRWDQKGHSHDIVVFVCHPLNDPTPPTFDIEIADACFFPLQSLPECTDLHSRFNIADYVCMQANSNQQNQIEEQS